MFFQVETKLWRDEILVAREHYFIQAPLQSDAEMMASHAAEDSPFWNPDAMMRASFAVDPVQFDSIPHGAPVIVSTLSDTLSPTSRDAGLVRPGIHPAAIGLMDWQDDVVEPLLQRPALGALVARVAISDATGGVLAMEDHVNGLGLPRNDRPANPEAATRFGIEFSGAFLLGMAGEDLGPTSRQILETLGGHTAASIRVNGSLDGPSIAYEILDHHGRKVADGSLDRMLAAAEILGCPNVAYTSAVVYSETVAGISKASEIPAMAFSLLATFQAEHDIRQIQASLDGAGIHAHLSVNMDFTGNSPGRHEGVRKAAYARMRGMMAGWDAWFPSASGRIVPERLVLGGSEILYHADLSYDIDSETRH